MKAKTLNLRMKIVAWVFRRFKKLMPPMSPNEAEALAAGKVGAERTLLYKPDWKGLEGSLQPILSSEEQAFLDGPVEGLCKMVSTYRVTEKGGLPKEAWEYITKIRIFGMNTSKEYGGLGFSKRAQREVIVKIATRDMTLAVVAMVPNSLGPAELLAHYGTKEQKARWLSQLSSGEVIPCFALTSQGAGSDASGGLIDSGRTSIDEDGRTMISFNANKRYITLAPVAGLVGLAFRLYDPDGLLGGDKDRGITIAIIPVNEATKSSGLSIGRWHDPLGGYFPNGPVVVRNIFLPLDECVIGGLEGVGKGWVMLMECLFAGRGISLPSVSVGGAKFCVRTVGAYARIRKQFGQSIADFGGIETLLAKMGGLLYLMDAVGHSAARSVDEGGKRSGSSPIISAIAKSHLTEHLRTVVNCGMDILGGIGIMQGPKNFLAPLYNMLNIAITVEGSNRVTVSFMVFGQGFTRCHPALFEEMQAVASSDAEALMVFRNALMKHIRYTLSVSIRAVFHAYGGWRLSSGIKRRKLNKYYKKLNRVSSALGFLSEVVIIFALGGKFKTEERLSERFGKVLASLYISACILERFAREGEREEDRVFAEWGLQYELHEAQMALEEILENFPRSLLGSRLMSNMCCRIVPWLIFPYGRPFALPKDWMEKKMAKAITTPGLARDHLTEGMYLPDGDSGEQLALLEEAMNLTVLTEDLEKKMRKAAKSGIIPHHYDIDSALKSRVISGQEREILKRLFKAREEVLVVDDFEPKDWLKL